MKHFYFIVNSDDKTRAPFTKLQEHIIKKITDIMYIDSYSMHSGAKYRSSFSLRKDWEDKENDGIYVNIYIVLIDEPNNDIAIFSRRQCDEFINQIMNSEEDIDTLPIAIKFLEPKTPDNTLH